VPSYSWCLLFVRDGPDRGSHREMSMRQLPKLARTKAFGRDIRSPPRQRKLRSIPGPRISSGNQESLTNVRQILSRIRTLSAEKPCFRRGLDAVASISAASHRSFDNGRTRQEQSRIREAVRASEKDLEILVKGARTQDTGPDNQDLNARVGSFDYSDYPRVQKPTRVAQSQPPTPIIQSGDIAADVELEQQNWGRVRTAHEKGAIIHRAEWL